MPTNDERREVAARLRNYENLRESFRESPICAFLDALGVGYIDWKGVCNRLAELIEPEPERTCRYCQHYKTLNLGRERYCHVWGRKEPMVHDRFFCGWWEKRKEQQGLSKE